MVREEKVMQKWACPSESLWESACLQHGQGNPRDSLGCFDWGTEGRLIPATIPTTSGLLCHPLTKSSRFVDHKAAAHTEASPPVSSGIQDPHGWMDSLKSWNRSPVPGKSTIQSLRVKNFCPLHWPGLEIFPQRTNKLLWEGNPVSQPAFKERLPLSEVLQDAGDWPRLSMRSCWRNTTA